MECARGMQDVGAEATSMVMPVPAIRRRSPGRESAVEEVMNVDESGVWAAPVAELHRRFQITREAKKERST